MADAAIMGDPEHVRGDARCVAKPWKRAVGGGAQIFVKHRGSYRCKCHASDNPFHCFLHVSIWTFVLAGWWVVIPVGNGERRELPPQFRDRQADAVGDA